MSSYDHHSPSISVADQAGVRLVTLGGEHDLTTAARIAAACAGPPMPTVIDLTATTFIDSSVIAELIAASIPIFGTPVRISRIIAAVAAVPGVQHAEVTRLQPLFGPAGNAVETGILPLAPLAVAQLDNDSARPENGLLTLDLGGGR